MQTVVLEQYWQPERRRGQEVHDPEESAYPLMQEVQVVALVQVLQAVMAMPQMRQEPPLM